MATSRSSAHPRRRARRRRRAGDADGAVLLAAILFSYFDCTPLPGQQGGGDK